MDEDDYCRHTLFVNDTGIEIKVRYNGWETTLGPRRDRNNVVSVRWNIHDPYDTYLPLFEVEGVKLDHKISPYDLYYNRGITIFRDEDNSCYSFRALSLSSDQDSLLPNWFLNSELQLTTFVNRTDIQIEIEYDGGVYPVKPNSENHVRWFTSYHVHTHSERKLQLRGIELGRSISVRDLYCNVEITIFKSVDSGYSFRTLSEEDLRQRVNETKDLMEKRLLRMEELLKKVTIWHKQCEHLVVRFRQGVRWMVQVFRFSKFYTTIRGTASFMESKVRLARSEVHLVRFVCLTVICCMLEGQELLQFCGENGYTKAAFELSSPKPSSAPTFSRFALVLRELDWTLDVCFFGERRRARGVWEWCEKSCRLKYKSWRYWVAVSEKELLEADNQRSTVDREALQEILNSKLIGIPSSSNTPVVSPSNCTGISSFFQNLYGRLRTETQKLDNQDKLDIIWRKRLLAASHTSAPSLIPSDWFWIDKSDFEVVKHLASGAYKRVDECKWLGETVAVAVLDVSKEEAQAEAGLLARMQHPNVVELMGYYYEDDPNDDRNSHGFLVTELMKQDLESLIRQQWRSLRAGSTIQGPPFPLPVAVDISLQIAEAMIHLRECGVLHRDLKPKNCLASPKFRKDSTPRRKDSMYSDIPMYYNIKLIDFGTAKMRDEDSYFHSRRKGTPYYMAPEIYGRSEEECVYTWSSDVYSFGMTCFEVFTGRAPFKNRTKFAEVQAFICGGGRPQFPFELPIPVKELIERCWAQNPADRPSFQEIRKDLWRCKLYAAQSSSHWEFCNEVV